MMRMPTMSGHDPNSYPFPPGPPPAAPMPGQPQAMPLALHGAPAKPSLPKWVIPTVLGGILLLGGAAYYFANKAKKEGVEEEDDEEEDETPKKPVVMTANDRLKARLAQAKRERAARKKSDAYLAPKKTRKKAKKNAVDQAHEAALHSSKPPKRKRAMKLRKNERKAIAQLMAAETATQSPKPAVDLHPTDYLGTTEYIGVTHNVVKKEDTISF